MQVVTKATLAQLQEPVWFTNVGKPDNGHKESETAILVASWSTAYRRTGKNYCMKLPIGIVSNWWCVLRNDLKNGIQ